MNEIADELERMAAFYDQESKTHEEMRVEARKSWDEAEGCFQQGKAEMCTEVATRLRERAAEIRAQRSAPAYKAQPKPRELRLDQWWMLMTNEPEATRVSLGPFRIGDDTDFAIGYAHEFFTCDDWIYLGNADQPQNA